MPVDLGPLVFDARAAPLSNVFVDTRPDDFAADEMLGGPDASMLVVCVEESPAEGRRDERSHGRVLALFTADQVVIHCVIGVGHCSYGNPREGISGLVVRAPDVTDVCGEL